MFWYNVLDRTGFVLQDSGNLQWVEFFAGEAQATRMHAFGGFKVAKLDIEYMSAADSAHANPMDLLTDPGMAFLDCKIIRRTLVFWTLLFLQELYLKLLGIS